MRLAILMVAGLAVLGAPAGAKDAIEWQANSRGETRTYHIQGLALTFKSHDIREDDWYRGRPVLTVRARGAAPFVFRGVEGFSPASAQFDVVRVDPHNADPQILISTFTGGAHCCSEFALIERWGDHWKAVKLGSWDGDGLVVLPVDVDGDGIVDLVFADNRFLYVFAAYAGGSQPRRIFNVVDGRVVDVSKAPRYRKLFEKDLADDKENCAASDNGGCAAYVADAARLGRIGAAWKFMLAHYSKGESFEAADPCPKKSRGRACRATADYPHALRRFLETTGYIETRRPADSVRR